MRRSEATPLCAERRHTGAENAILKLESVLLINSVFTRRGRSPRQCCGKGGSPPRRVQNRQEKEGKLKGHCHLRGSDGSAALRPPAASCHTSATRRPSRVEPVAERVALHRVRVRARSSDGGRPASYTPHGGLARGADPAFPLRRTVTLISCERRDGHHR